MMPHTKSTDDFDIVSYSKQQELFRTSKHKILLALRDLRKRNFMVYTKVDEHSDMLTSIYNKPKEVIARYRGAIYTTIDDENCFWQHGSMGISYAQICYSQNNWSEDPHIVAKEIVNIMRSYNLNVIWDGKVEKKIVVGIVLH